MARKGILEKLSPEVIKNAGTLAANGMTDRGIYNYLGISHETFYRWLKLGEEKKTGPAHEFSETIKKGRAHLEGDCLKDIIQAGKSGEWQARAWILERRWPEDYGKRDKLDVTAKNITIVDNMDDE